MTAPPDLSIVVVTYECRPYVMDLLGDLAAARNDLSLEVFVVDNASTDGTVEAIRAAHPWVDVDAQAENLGFGKANNRAIPKAQAQTLLLLNPDTRVTANGPLGLCRRTAPLPRRGDPDPPSGR